jgi:methylenetetrahydrofolate reductase (NADPH)
MLSFEFFPPKTEQGQLKLIETAKELTKLKPHFFSVTYGAGGSTRDGTIDTVKLIHEITGVNTAPHLACITASKEDLVSILQSYKDLNIQRIVALRGDLPSGVGQVGEFHYAYQLVELIREITAEQFHIEVAGYPECHPQANDFGHDLDNLKRKIDAGANSVITQYFYNLDSFFYFRDRAVQAGIKVPIIPGIMPIVNFAKVTNFSQNCGAEIPRWLTKQIEAYKDDIDAIQTLTLDFVTHLCQKLLEGGVHGLHFYTLNQPEMCVAICNHL